MRYGSLFTGAGGLDLAVHMLWPDAELLWWSEVDEPAAASFARHTDAPNLGDITAIDWSQLREDMGLPARKKDAPSAEMYEMYRQGHSLEEVGDKFGLTRQAVWERFKNRNWELRPKPGPRPTVKWNGRKYSLRNNGYMGCTTGDRQLLHRDVWEHHNGPIPDGYDIHHIDHDKTNNDLSNLECLPRDEHARRYSTGCNQHSHTADCPEHGEVVAKEAPALDMIAGGFP